MPQLVVERPVPELRAEELVLEPVALQRQRVVSEQERPVAESVQPQVVLVREQAPAVQNPRRLLRLAVSLQRQRCRQRQSEFR